MKRYIYILISFTFVNYGFPQINQPIVPNTVSDKCIPIPYKNQKVNGLFGERLNVLVEKGLLGYDVDAYIKAYYGDRIADWPAGEYLGKYFIANLKMYEYTNSLELMDQMKRIIKTWDETLPDDGYQSIRMSEDEVKWLGDFTGLWELKYVILALVDYYLSFGDEQALDIAKKIGNCIAADFGYSSDKRDIMSAGALRLGTASVLEPMVYLYRITGEPQYLEFCNYVMIAHEQDPNGTKMISEMLHGSGNVNKVGGKGIWQKAKSYEMLSAYVGILRMYQLTGRQQYLDACLAVWEDIYSRRLYITGTSGTREFFRHEYFLPGEQEDSVGEGCVTAHWIFLSKELFFLTGDTKYIDEIEKSLYNHLLGSQSPFNGNQSYYTALIGHKNFNMPNIYEGEPPCCMSSVMRCIAKIPEIIWTKSAEGGINVLLYNAGELEIDVSRKPDNIKEIKFIVETNYPNSGRVKITVSAKESAKFNLGLRVPSWCTKFAVVCNGKESYEGESGSMLNLNREWKSGDKIEINMDMNIRFVEGNPMYAGYYAFIHGPLVFALDEELNPGIDVEKVNRFLNNYRKVGLVNLHTLFQRWEMMRLNYYLSHFLMSDKTDRCLRFG
jgi:DUF1680 family protein